MVRLRLTVHRPHITFNHNELLGGPSLLSGMEACDVNQRIEEVQASGLFPHPLVRGGQERFLEDARMCMAQRTHLLAHAPTGLGKTAVALTAAVETAIASDGAVLFLTSRQSQHAIAVETMRAMWRKEQVAVVDLIAREDMCLANRSGEQVPCTCGARCYFDRDPDGSRSILLDYPLHVQEAMGACLRSGICPHRAAMEAAREARVIIGDYNQMFCRGPDLLQRLGRREEDAILVIDEGHNLPYRIMDSGSGQVTPASLRRARAAASLKHFKEDLDVLSDSLHKLARRRPERIIAEDLDGPLKRCSGVDAGGLAVELEAVSRGDPDVRVVVDFLHAWSAPEEFTVRYLEGDAPCLKVGLIDPAPLASPVVSRVRCALLMSGTLHPPEMFADLLGMRNAVCRSYPSPFPRQNRLVVAGGKVSSRFRTRGPAMYAQVAEEVARCISGLPGNAAAFFPSYEFMGQVEGHLAGMVQERRLLVERREHGKREREAILRQLHEGTNLLMGTVSGSFSEGVDFPHNILSMVIVVGLPLSPPSREMEAMLEHMEGRFGARKANLYVQVYPAVSRVLQAAGRAIRSETDRAAIVLLDDRYMLPYVRAAFPADLSISCPQDLLGEVASFLSPSDHEAGALPAEPLAEIHQNSSHGPPHPM